LAIALPTAAHAWTGFTTTSLNLRASAAGAIITSMPPGSPVEVVGSCGGRWYHVVFAGIQGCAHSAYITTQMAYAPYPHAYPYPGPGPWMTPPPPYGWYGARVGLSLGILGLALHAAHHHW
jgi:hypothetical protein